VKQPKSGHDDKNQLSQCKELWLFWYGEKPVEQLRTLVSDSLKEIAESSGSWEAGIPYEARTLLFKALNNLIERNLLSREFVRIGKWFVQPFEGGSADRPTAKTSHLRQVSGSHTLLVSFTIDSSFVREHKISVPAKAPKSGNYCCGSGFIVSGSGISSESGSRSGPSVLMTKNLKNTAENFSKILILIRTGTGTSADPQLCQKYLCLFALYGTDK
jgi:hypothetical protein